MVERNIAMRDMLLKSIHSFMLEKSNIMFVSGDFGSPILDLIRRDFPKRFVNVGIAEQNLINFSAGLALEGKIVFAYAIAPFLTMRALEQIRVNLALLSTIRNINVSLLGVGAGYSYVVSGPTHQCYEDISIINSIPGIDIYSPSNAKQAGELAKTLVAEKGIKYVRLDAQVLPSIEESKIYTKNQALNGFDIYEDVEREAILVSTGYMVHKALELKRKKAFSVIDLYNITGFSRKKLSALLKKYKYVFSLEEGFIGAGGLDSVIRQLIYEQNLEVKHIPFGIKKEYSFELGTREELHEKSGLSVSQLDIEITKLIQSK